MKKILLLVCLILLVIGNVEASPARLVSPIQNEEGIWETDNIKITFDVFKNAGIGMLIENRTDSPMRFNWNESMIECVATWNVRDVNGLKPVLVVPPHYRAIALLIPQMSVPLTMHPGYDESIAVPIEINGEVRNYAFTLIMK